MVLMPEVARRGRAGPYGIIAALAVGSATMALMQTLIVPVLPALPAIFGSSISSTSWAATAALVAGAVASPVAGRMGDLYGKRPAVLVSLGLSLVGLVISALAVSLPMLIAGRALQGAGAGVISLAYGILRDDLPPALVARGVALMTAVSLAVGAGLGPVAMGAILDRWGWRSVFWSGAAMAVVALILAAALLDSSPRGVAAAFDWIGAGGLSLALVALLLAITRGSEWGWSSPATIGLFTVAVALGLVWSRWERRLESPLVDLVMTLRRPVLITHLGGAMVGFATFMQYVATFTLVSLSTATGFGFGRTMVVAGLTQVPGAVAMAVAVPIAGRVAATRGPRGLLTLGSLAIALGFVISLVRHDELWQVTLGATVIYAGLGLAFSALPMLVMANVPVDETASANAVNAVSRVVGSAIGAAVASAVLASGVATIAGARFPERWTFAVIYVLGAAGALGAAVLARRLPAYSPISS